MNKKIYIWTIIISILILIPTCICNCAVLMILSGIGCSGIAAAIMAIFLDALSSKRENERKAKSRAIYFCELKEQLKMMLERILWFEKRMSDEFNWDSDPANYSTFQYMLSASQRYPNEEKMTFQDAEIKLNELKEKYSLEQQSSMSKEQLYKVQRMFLILYASGLPLLSEANSIKERRVELDAEEYLSLKEIEEICFQISLSFSLMCKPKKDYGISVSSLVSAYKTICRVGNYDDNLSIGLHGTIKMSEI